MVRCCIVTLGARALALLIIRQAEAVCFDVRDARPVLPGRVGCGTVEAAGTRGAVRLEARGGDVVTGPLAGAVMTRRFVEGAHLERADAGLDAAVVRRRARRRVEGAHVVLLEQRLELRGDER